MNRSRKTKLLLGSVTAMALIVSAAAAGAQPAPPPPGYGGDYGPPPGSAAYDAQAQQYDEAYADRYQAWAGQYCVQREHQNVAAGAIIGGALGAMLGAGLSHGHAGGTIVGGALGAGAGASVAANSSVGGGCPPGYVIRAGAPGFYYDGPVVYAPPGYNPWIFIGGRYTYVPYRAWYWRHHGWRGDHRHY